MHDNLIATESTAAHTLDLPALHHLAKTLRLDNQPQTIFRAVHDVAKGAIGFTLFTIMSYDAQRHEVERVYSNMPNIYPVGGRKEKRGTAWAGQILRELKPFRAKTADGIREAFDDHAVMTGMGLGSILNIPIAYDGVCVGTMNLTHVEHWYTDLHEEAGLLIGSFLVPALIACNTPRAGGTVSI